MDKLRTVVVTGLSMNTAPNGLASCGITFASGAEDRLIDVIFGRAEAQAIVDQLAEQGVRATKPIPAIMETPQALDFKVMEAYKALPGQQGKMEAYDPEVQCRGTIAGAPTTLPNADWIGLPEGWDSARLVLLPKLDRLESKAKQAGLDIAGVSSHLEHAYSLMAKLREDHTAEAVLGNARCEEISNRTTGHDKETAEIVQTCVKQMAAIEYNDSRIKRLTERIEALEAKAGQWR